MSTNISKILIVDDGAFNIVSIQLMLSTSFGLDERIYDFIAKNGKEAVDLVKKDIIRG